MVVIQLVVDLETRCDRCDKGLIGEYFRQITTRNYKEQVEML